MKLGIDQREIKQLLMEASDPTCTEARREIIRDSLLHGLPGMPSARRDREHLEISHVLTDLLESTIRHRPEILPSLFPFFALACGEREDNYLFAEIDWTLLN
jgi:hypothetical protein